MLNIGRGSMIKSDIIIIGAGIAGASIAAKLSETKNVIILDMEGCAGYHTTGRSAALFTENYGTPTIRALTRASRSFFTNPPEKFCEHPLLTPRGMIYLARHDQLQALEKFKKNNSGVKELTGTELRGMIPYLKSENIVAGLLEADSSDIDVNSLHMGFLRQAKNNGARLLNNQTVTALEWRDKNWIVTASLDEFNAPIVVNAAGAWADEVAKLAGVAMVQLRPLKRTAAIVQFDKPIDPDMFFLNDIDENWYCKPEGNHLFLSPEDEVPSPPCDAWADDMDIALVIEKITKVLDLEPVKVESSWAGLRTFAPDNEFVIGYAPDAVGFFWLAGQGGYGIQTAPAVAELATSLVNREALPSFIAEQNLEILRLLPERFR